MPCFKAVTSYPRGKLWSLSHEKSRVEAFRKHRARSFGFVIDLNQNRFMYFW
jgi:hypothetical protein